MINALVDIILRHKRIIPVIVALVAIGAYINPIQLVSLVYACKGDNVLDRATNTCVPLSVLTSSGFEPCPSGTITFYNSRDPTNTNCVDQSCTHVVNGIPVHNTFTVHNTVHNTCTNLGSSHRASGGGSGVVPGPHVPHAQGKGGNASNVGSSEVASAPNQTKGK